MHGLINKAIQCFVLDTYRRETWREMAQSAALPVMQFEAMLIYEDTCFLRFPFFNLIIPTSVIVTLATRLSLHACDITVIKLSLSHLSRNFSKNHLNYKSN